MTISYYLDNPLAVVRQPIASFQDFSSWLWGMGVGVVENDPSVLAEWAKVYREWSTGHFKPSCFARARAELHKVISVTAVEP